MSIDFLSIIRRVVKNNFVQREDKIEDDSLLFISIIVELELASGRQISIEKIYTEPFETYDDLLSIFEN